MTAPLPVAIVTGGHPYDIARFRALFQDLPGIAAHVVHLDDWACATREQRAAYRTVVFYLMFMDGPRDDGVWYQGKARSALEELGTSGQGVVLLHHALLAYPQWPFWSELVGIADRRFGYHLRQRPRYVVADREHPITRQLADWEMDDETYTMAEPGPDSAVLLSTAHQPSMRAIAWIRQVGAARVLCFQCGHDAQAWGDLSFRAVLERGIRWTAAAEPELPATMLGVIFPERGRAVLRREPTPALPPGRILCRTRLTGVTNGTERNVLLGGNYGGTYPSRCGYQNVGEVIAIGPGPSDYAVGDRVFDANFAQHTQYFTASAAADDLAIALPPAISDHQAALLGMAGVALHDVRRARVALGERVLVVGAGPVGQFLAQAARACGALVTVADLDRRRLDLAKGLGAHHVVDTAAGWKEVEALGPFDCVLEASGAPVLDEIIGRSWRQGVLRNRGRVLLIAGRARVDYAFNAGQGTEIEILQASHFSRDDLVLLCRLVADGVMRTEPIIQEVLPIDQAPAFYERLRAAPQDTFGTVFDWTGASAAMV